MTETMQALKTIEGGDARVMKDVPIPEPEDYQILAETRALSLNPTDYKHMRGLTVPGSTLGTDWSGIVLKVGKNVTRFKPGDEVWGVCHGGNNQHLDFGSFGQKIVCAEQATCHKPANMTFEEAATLGVGTVTCGQVMYHTASLPYPAKENLTKPPTKDILIYGGSSGTGTLAIQFAKLSGYRVLTTASPSNHDLLLSRGADLVFDYKDTSTPSAIKAHIGDDLTYILDCIGTSATAEFCAPLLSSKGGHYHSVQFPVKPRFKELRSEDSVKATSALGYTMLGIEFAFKNGMTFPVDEKEVAFAKGWVRVVDGLLKQGLLKAHPMEVRDGLGLEGVLQGMYDMEAGTVSGTKLVFPMKW